MQIPPDAVVMIIGAMKSGTTSLFNYLAQHPEICPAVQKEPEFFSRKQEHGASVPSYFDLWAFDTGKHKFALEASTGYSKYPFEQGVPQRIKDYGLRPKFVYCVRDPLERIRSHVEFVSSNPAWGNVQALSEQTIALSKYHTQLSRYTRLFPKEDILIVDFDQIRTAPQLATNKVIDFLGLAAHDLSDLSAANKTRRPGRLELVLRKRFPALRNILPESLKKSLKESAFTSSRTNEFKLSDQETQRLRKVLAKDMHALERDFSIDVSRWGF